MQTQINRQEEENNQNDNQNEIRIETELREFGEENEDELLAQNEALLGIKFYSFNPEVEHDRQSFYFFSVYFVFFTLVHIIQLLKTLEIDNIYLYLAYQSYVINLVFLLVAMLYTIKGRVSRSSFLWKGLRIVHNLALSTQATVVMTFWGTTRYYNDYYIPAYCDSPTWCVFHSIVVHGLSAMPAWISVIGMYTGIHWKDVIWTTLYGIGYVMLVWRPVTLTSEELCPGVTFMDFKSYTYAFSVVWLMVIFSLLGYLISLKKRQLSIPQAYLELD